MTRLMCRVFGHRPQRGWKVNNISSPGLGFSFSLWTHVCGRCKRTLAIEWEQEQA